MRYFGGKYNISKWVVSVCERYRREGQPWVEPFVGGGNVIFRATGRRIGSDINKYVIALLSAVRDGWDPPSELTEDEYKFLKKKARSKEVVDFELAALIGFAGTCCSFAGRWFEGYARGGSGRNYALEGRRQLLRVRDRLKGVEFKACCYRDLDIPEKSLIYCDPPYKGTKGFGVDKSFDSQEFYEWCRAKAMEGHTVLISEYNAPEDFICVAEKVKTIGVRTKDNGNEVRVERIFLVG